ncbi:MAG: HD family phosphohydrolase [Tuberibacillus sp.]
MNMKRFSTLWQRVKKSRLFSYIIYCFIGIILYVSMINAAIPDTVHVELHDIAKNDIQSPVEIVDQETTNNLKRQASANTPSTYVFNKDTAMIQVEKTGDIFNILEELRQELSASQEAKNPDGDQVKNGNQLKAQLAATMEDMVKKAHEKLANYNGNQLSDDTIKTLLSISDSDLALAEEITNSTIYDTMSNKIKWATLEDAQSKAIQSIPKSVVKDDLRAALSDILRYAIIPNYVFDAQATKKNKEEAVKSIEPVVIHQGEVIVKKGDLVTWDVLHKLQVVGLLDNHFKILPFLGLAILTLFLTLLLVEELNRLKGKSEKKYTSTLLMCLCIHILTIIIIELGNLLRNTHIASIELVVPAACGPLLIAILINKRLAFAASVVYAVSAGYIFGGAGSSTGSFNSTMAIYILFTTVAGAMVWRGTHGRLKLLQIGLIISVINVLSVVSLLLLKGGTIHILDAGIQIGFAVLSAFLATVLTIGLMPFFEAVFNILSPMKLIELSNPNHPLLRKILIEAPGTYHHSVMVANLAERACEAIGANGLLARVTAYYHDLGKTKRPRFFVENQMNGENPHDKISPHLSKTIIMAHPYDGAKMLKEAKIPKEIVDIAEQHHGTTLIKYFYFKAKEMSGDTVLESEFRYPGPKAQTKEAAVVELADSVEAAVRSMKHPTPEKIEALIQSIFNDRLEDGQFDECGITMKELHLVKASLIETLKGVFHSRIEYPEEIAEKKAKSS